MTHKEKLEALEKAIREALPELMEISRGCKMIWTPNPHHGIYEVFIDSVQVSYEPENYKYEVVRFYSIYNGFNEFETDVLDQGNFKIIGHDIQLHHVLKWLNIIETEYIVFDLHISVYGEFTCTIDEPSTIISTEIFWDLSKPLKDQKKDIVDYLFNLI